MSNYSVTITFAVTGVTDDLFTRLADQCYTLEQVCDDIVDLTIGVTLGALGEIEFGMAVLDVANEQAAGERAKDVVGLVIAATGGVAPDDFAVAKHMGADLLAAA